MSKTVFDKYPPEIFSIIINEAVITKKEIIKLIRKRPILKDTLGKHKEKGYKEVYVYNCTIYFYDVYRKRWSSFPQDKNSGSYKLFIHDGFYTYKDLESVFKSRILLNKNKVYFDEIYAEIFIYNKGLSVWECINTDFLGDARKNLCLPCIRHSSFLLSSITKKEFDKILLIRELVS